GFDRRPVDGAPRRGGAPLVARQPRAVRDDRSAPRRRAAWRGDRAPERRARRDVDGHRLARDDGERRSERSPGGSAHIEQLIRQNARVAVTETLTRLDCAVLDGAIDRGTKRLLELQRPNGVWVGELESNVTMTAQHLFWHHSLGLRPPDEDRRIANELMARMR